MDNNELAKHLFHLRRKQGRLTKAVQEKAAELAQTNDELCEALCETSARALAAGLIDEETGKFVIEPKD